MLKAMLALALLLGVLTLAGCPDDTPDTTTGTSVSVDQGGTTTTEEGTTADDGGA